MTQTKLSEERIKENHVNVDVVPYWKLTSECSHSKCRAFLKLFFFPHGGGKLSKKRTEIIESLSEFDITQDLVDRKVNQAKQTIKQWQDEMSKLSEHEDLLNNAD